jgi:hypothetical protein
MPHVFERAPTGRAKCRGCGRAIAQGELRFGERVPNPFAEGTETTLWFHPHCAAYKRPAPLLEALAETTESIADRDALEALARPGLEHHRLPRIDGAERAPTGQAKCRHCRQPIGRGGWRIRLVFFEDGRFAPSGFAHLECREAYFEGMVTLEHLLCFRPLADEDREALASALAGAPG